MYKDYNRLSNSFAQWYVRHYPDDPVGESLNPKSTWFDLLTILTSDRTDYYTYLAVVGIDDPDVRSILFERLEKLSPRYDKVYFEYCYASIYTRSFTND